MDDAQQIVLVALEQAGVDVPAEVKKSNGQELGSKALVSICSQAVALLLSRGVSSSSSSSSSSSAVAAVFEVPQGTAERFRFCTDLAAAIKQLGYQADLSFHQVPFHALSLSLSLCLCFCLWFFFCFSLKIGICNY
jgi:hypothetical protein